MPTGMTLKQIHMAEFCDALEAYKVALATRTNIVAASLRIHAAKGGVPKSWHSLVGKAFRESGTKRKDQAAGDTNPKKERLPLRQAKKRAGR